MNITHLKPSQILKTEPFWLASIAAGLAAICLTLVWKAHDVGHLGMSLLFFFAIGSILWDKRHTFNFESDVFSSVVGWLIISWVLWQSTTHNLGYIIRLLPLASAIGVGLLASGFKGVKQYWEALIILFFLEIPSVLAELFLDISPYSAKFASLILWYLGFDVTLNGVYIHLPTGSVKVVPSCSGIDTINYLLGISIIALVMFPIAKNKRLFVSLFAMFLGFFLNAIRIAILAVMVGTNEAAFHSWHGGNASYSFGVFGILIFGAFYMFILRQEERQIQKMEKS
ncbi:MULTISPECIES: cyanoexosortase A [Calothrix]|uniref:Cyanoexosortase A n=2 Tax=Calothrix TaxID=1186 RepID=A0ABR8A9Q8_9CYAN|nr:MULTISPECIES: cyanoexosortase A [Calothrix]MBD2196730.1 cyanoexosortase A [Calothrix parietina FACHB-288]MBD2224170.1 cyanoexosortase A [Calothrix anomala FACHB-343]